MLRYVLLAVSFFSLPISAQEKATKTFDTAIFRTIRSVLDTILINDQKFRGEYTECNDFNSTECKKLAQLIKTNDSENIKKVSKILDTYGWPDIKYIGELRSETILLVLLHTDIRIQEHYLSVVEQAVYNRKLAASSYAYYVDKICVQKGDDQIFGTQLQVNPINGRLRLYPTKNVNDLDERRKRVGLSPIKEYLSSLNATMFIENPRIPAIYLLLAATSVLSLIVILLRKYKFFLYNDVYAATWCLFCSVLISLYFIEWLIGSKAYLLKEKALLALEYLVRLTIVSVGSWLFFVVARKLLKTYALVLSSFSVGLVSAILLLISSYIHGIFFPSSIIFRYHWSLIFIPIIIFICCFIISKILIWSRLFKGQLCSDKPLK